MASQEFADDSEEKRPTVQVGDPFTEKCLLEACLELMASGAVIAIQDMGAAGLTCSAVEMGAKGNLGIDLDLDKVPCREERMSAYEMMLSESQERMLVVLDPAHEKDAEAIFNRWGLDFAIVGETTDNLRFRIFHDGEEVANLPIKELGDEAPEYDRPWVAPASPAQLPASEVPAPNDITDALRTIMGSPDMCSRRWVWEQYDHLIQSNTAQIPGGDAAVLRVEGAPHKGLACCVDVTPRYVEADAFEGGKQAVAEVWRNLTCVGADPIAITDNLNFGNPERPEIMGTFVKAIEGIGEACNALDFPVVSGNVSLYNETNGEAILPTPAIGGVGLLPDLSKMTTIAFKNEGDAILMLGAEPQGHLGQSIYLREILGREEGPPPGVDLELERKSGDCVRALISSRALNAVHDISDGGMAAALAEMAMAGDLGAEISLPDNGLPAHGALFGEDQSIYIVSCAPENVDTVLQAAEAAGIHAAWLGSAGGKELKFAGHGAISVAALCESHDAWLPRFMAGA
ncbi:MAG: phosphoribosylformylglycinamidine synthase subunit PurL, partial [Hyphomicrobiales bacterium]